MGSLRMNMHLKDMKYKHTKLSLLPLASNIWQNVALEGEEEPLCHYLLSHTRRLAVLFLGQMTNTRGVLFYACQWWSQDSSRSPSFWQKRCALWFDRGQEHFWRRLRVSRAASVWCAVSSQCVARSCCGDWATWSLPRQGQGRDMEGWVSWQPWVPNAIWFAFTRCVFCNHQ